MSGPQLALFSLAAPASTPPAAPPTERPRRVRSSAKPKKDQQDIRAKLTREEREQEDRAGRAAALDVLRDDRRTNEVKRTSDVPVRACPQCPVEHPENRPGRLPVDDDQGELFTGESRPLTSTIDG